MLQLIFISIIFNNKINKFDIEKDEAPLDRDVYRIQDF